MSNAITESEAAVYDRQIRLWGLEAQQRMRNSTVLVINLKSLAAETIKNLVLAGIGRLVVMDSEDVSERDLGAGFLFREGDGVVGQKRVTAALPQIQSLNPLVTVTPLTTTAPFISAALNSDDSSREAKMAEFLRTEKVDIVCVVESSIEDARTIGNACRRCETLFYTAGTYGFTGYIFADLGAEYDFVAQSTEVLKPNETPKMISKRANGFTFSSLSDQTPFKGKNKRSTLASNPGYFCALFALWNYESIHGRLPLPSDDQRAVKEELRTLAEEFRESSLINKDAFPTVNESIIEHLASHATHEFNPTSAVLGGILAQDVLRAISRSGTPILNFLIFDGLSVGEGAAGSGGGIVVPWGITVAEMEIV